MEIEADGANLENLEKDIVLIFYALDSRTSGAEAATEAVAVEDNEAVADEDNKVVEGNTDAEAEEE